MTIFNALNLIGGLCLFLFGMNLMGQALERRAGSGLRSLLEKMTQNRLMGLLAGLGVTAVIQSSSATTVMVVGFVNSGLMTLRQSIGVIMGANIGTTVTAWILSLSGIEGSSLLVQMFKPSTFTPILALVGIILYMFCKADKKKDTGMILLGFATLMFGMEAMSSAVSSLRNVPQFREIFLMFSNPILGVLVGAVLTGIIQSSSASVGILQALASTGQVTYGAAIPIIMGQNIGTCVTALLSSIGTNKNARRAALVHLNFNVIGATVGIVLFYVVRAVAAPALLGQAASEWGIAVAHSIFNILCTAVLLPMGGLLEKLVLRLVPEGKQPQREAELDERLLATPALALERCRTLIADMASYSMESLRESLNAITAYNQKSAEHIREDEAKTDHYEDIIGSYLVKLSARKIGESDSALAAEYLRIIGDFERIADHSVNILESAEEMQQKGIAFSAAALQEYATMAGAVREVTALAYDSFVSGDVQAARQVEPLEQVIDDLKEEMRTRHIRRMQQGSCGIEAGFIWSDLLTNLERVSDHCSNIACCMIEGADHNLHRHEVLQSIRGSGEIFDREYSSYRQKYALTAE
ncbi:MAG: Na/Pi cotransporter family protein [Angelakisella sp.]|jgi:Na/Pi-cotransporter II-like protein